MKVNRLIGYPSELLGSALMSLSFFFMKNLMDKTGAPVVDILSFRYLICSLIFAVLLLIRKEKRSLRRPGLKMLILGGTMRPAILNLLEFGALNYIASSESAMYFALGPVVMSVLAYILFKEKISRETLICMLISIFGVIFINIFDFNIFSSGNIGRLMIFFALIAASLGRVLTRASTRNYSTFETTAVMTFLPAAVFTFISLVLHGSTATLDQYFNMFLNTDIYFDIFMFSIVCCLIGLFFETLGSALLPIGEYSILSLSSTPFMIFFGVSFMNETIEWYDLVGCLVIMAGIVGLKLIQNKDATN